MMEQPKLNAAQPIVLEDGTMAQAFRTVMQTLMQQVPIVGTGSPEGVVEALQYSVYVDETTPATPVTYRKMQAHIGGDRTKGWAAV